MAVSTAKKKSRSIHPSGSRPSRPDGGEGARPQGQSAEHEPREVESGPNGVELSGSTIAAREGQHPEEDVEPEHGVPRPPADQNAADHRSEGQGEAGHRGPDSEGPSPFVRPG